MADTCDHGFRWGALLGQCLQSPHMTSEHTGMIDGARVVWRSGDRRDFIGADPGQCDAEAPADRDDAGWSNVDAGPGSRCILPAGHSGRHAS